MTIEALLRAAEAAGFATASDENEQPAPKAAVEPKHLASTASPRDVLSFFGATRGSHEPLAQWTRNQIANLLPVWPARG
jgi:hypothetical protein